MSLANLEVQAYTNRRSYMRIASAAVNYHQFHLHLDYLNYWLKRVFRQFFKLIIIFGVVINCFSCAAVYFGCDDQLLLLFFYFFFLPEHGRRRRRETNLY